MKGITVNNMIEKRVYSDWAFKENENEKAKMNRKIFKELNEKFKIKKATNISDSDMEKYDIVIQLIDYEYCRECYKILKAPDNVSAMELALLCDDGNLCFGCSTAAFEGFKTIDIYVD